MIITRRDSGWNSLTKSQSKLEVFLEEERRIILK